MIDAPNLDAWAIAVEKLIRNLHTVTCVSGPIIEQTLHRQEAWGYIVEFVLVAANPFVYGVTRPIDLPPSASTIIQDSLFNLVPYPSAELEGAEVVVSTNYSRNPSVELDAVDWVKSSGGSVVAAQATGGRFIGVSAVGSASYRVHFAPTATSATAGTITATNTTATFSPTVAGQRMSVSAWASAIKESGTAVVSKAEVFVSFRDAGNVLLGTEVLVGTVPVVNGLIAGSVNKKGIAVPVGAVTAAVRATASLASWSTGAIVDLYVDAVAVTVP
jgi:hypothetical protein